MRVNNEVRPPKILGQCRNALKFINKVLEKNLNHEDLYEASLYDKINKKYENSVEDERSPSTSSISSKNEVKIEKEPEKGTMLKKVSTNGSIPELKRKFFINIWCTC